MYRYEEEVVPGDHESYHLQKLQQKIEARRKATVLEPKPDEIILKPTPTLDNEDTIEQLDIEHLKQIDQDQIVVDAVVKKSKTVEKTQSEFKVLGVKDFEKKIKVCKNQHFINFF